MRTRLQLVTAIGILIATAAALWYAITAMDKQYYALGGCWPENMSYTPKGGEQIYKRTVTFWLETYVPQLIPQPNAVLEFFLTRVNHRILFYLFMLSAMVGWSGSVCLRIATKSADRPDPPSPWEFFVSTLLLSGLGGVVLFLVLISGRLEFLAGTAACLPKGYAYLGMVASIAAGLFPVLFYKWFEGRAEGLWDAITSRFHSKPEDKNKGEKP